MYYARGAGVPEALRLRRADPQRHHDRAADRLAVLPRMGRDAGRVRRRGDRRRRARPARLSRPGLPHRQHLCGADGAIACYFDEERGLRGLAEAIRFCRTFEGRAGGLVRTMLAPDRIETCTPELLRRTAAAGRDLDVPVRQHSCQSKIEYEHGAPPARHEPARMDGEPRLSQRAHAAAARHLRVRLEPRRATRAAISRSSATPARRSCIARWSRRAAAT